MAKRVYIGGGLTVLWQSELCIHCETCWRGLPTVFVPSARPWVDMSGAAPEQIREQVGQCPSGALSLIDEKEGEK